MERDTVGKISSVLIQKEPDTYSPLEQMSEQLSDYDKHIFDCIELFKKSLQVNSDFYIVVITKKEPLMKNVLRSYFAARLSCPTPDYDQAVYKYNYKDESINFLWVIPSKDTCQLLRDNALIVHDSEKGLLAFVLDFYDDTLLRKAKKLNNEIYDSPLLAIK